MTTMTGEALRLHGVSMSFAGVTVLRDVDLELRRGEVHGLVGENGSGKSTLVKILGGVYTPDPGSAGDLWGQPIEFPLTRSHRSGIAIIHQDLALVDTMSVSENIGIGSSFDSRILSPIHKNHETKIAAELIKLFGLDIDPHALVGDLSPAERSIVGILRALRQLRSHSEDHLLILDEPTAALSKSEADRLLFTIRTIAAAGTSVLFISHHLKEVLEVCDRVSVLRSDVASRLQSSPDINYIIAGFDALVPLITAGEQQAGKTVHIVGGSGDNLPTARKNGLEQADVVYAPLDMLGWLFMDALLRGALGQHPKVSLNLQTLYSGNWGTDNADATLYPQLVGFQSRYKAAWGVG